MSRRLGFDIDSCFADFSSAYANLLIKTDGDRLPEGWKTNTDWLVTWFWERHYGYSSEVEKRVWDTHILPSKTFWKDLKPLSGAADNLKQIDRLSKAGYQCFFITNRPGNNAKRQTERWLYDVGFVEFPTVLVSAKKGPIIHALDLDLYIDDNGPTTTEVCELAKNALPKLRGHVYQPDYPYNREGRHLEARVVSGVKEMLEKEGLWNEQFPTNINTLA